MRHSKILVMLLGIILLVFVVGCSNEGSGENNPEESNENLETTVEDDITEKENVDNHVEEENEDSNFEEEKEDSNVVNNVEEEELRTEFEGISFVVPEVASEFDFGEQAFPMIGYLFDPMTGTNFNIVVEELPGSYTLEEYIDAATSLTGFEYLSNEYYSSNGLEWNEAISLNHTEQGTAKLSQKTFIINNKAFIFTYGSAPELFEEYLEEFNKITDTVEVVE